MSDLNTVPETETQSVAETEVIETPETVAATDKETEESHRLAKIERRIARITREKYQERARADFYEQQARQGQSQERGEPVPITDQDLETAFQRFQEQQTAKQKAERIQSKLNSVMDADADFAEALETSDVVFSDKHLEIMQDMVDEGDNGIEVLKYIAKTPGEADRLSQLSPTALARELGRLETKVLALKKPQVSQAAKPIETPRGTSSPSEPNPKDTAAWIKWKNEQEFRKK